MSYRDPSYRSRARGVPNRRLADACARPDSEARRPERPATVLINDRVKSKPQVEVYERRKMNRFPSDGGHVMKNSLRVAPMNVSGA